jgi:hypothetical protein
MRMLNGKTGQQNVAVGATLVAPIFSKFGVITQLFGQEARLMLFASTSLDANDFLQRDNIRVDRAQDFRDAFRPHATIQAATLMYVIRSDSQPTRSGSIFQRVTHELKYPHLPCNS